VYPRYEHFCHETQGWFIHKITIVTTVPKVAHMHFGAAKFLSSPAQVAKLIIRNQNVEYCQGHVNLSDDTQDTVWPLKTIDAKYTTVFARVILDRQR
jgi:hypothetical protein